MKTCWVIYSNKIETAGLRKCPYYHYLTKKVIGYHNNKHFAELAPHHGRKTAGIDMIRRNYVTVTICIFLLLHFAWGVAEAKCIIIIGHGRLCVCLCVCLSLSAFPHYCTDPDISWGMAGMFSSCASLDGFAISARVSLLWQPPNAKCQRVPVLALCLVNNSACRSRWPVFTDVQNDSHVHGPCLRTVFTARPHGPWTRVVCTEHNAEIEPMKYRPRPRRISDAVPGWNLLQAKLRSSR